MNTRTPFFDAPKMGIMAIIVVFVMIIVAILSRMSYSTSLVTDVVAFTSIISLVSLISIYVYFHFNHNRWQPRAIFLTGFIITIISLLLCSLYGSWYHGYYGIGTFLSYLRFYSPKALGIGILITTVVYFWLRIKHQDKELLTKEEDIQRYLTVVQAEKLPKNREVSPPNSEKTEKINQLLFDLQHLFETEKIYREQGLNLKEVAERLNTNRTYLSEIINQHHKKTFIEFVNTYRIEEVSAILKEQEEEGSEYANYTIQAIAEMVGFNSSSAFYTAFRQVVGATPIEYKKILKQEKESD